MTFFVFLVAGILHSSGNLSYFSGRGGLSSGKMKFLVQFAIRCECKRPLSLLDIEKREGQIDGRNREREDRKSEARGQNVSGRPNVICDTGDCPPAFFPVFSQARFGCSCCEIRYLARNKIEPFEKEVRTFGSSYFHGFHVGERGRGEQTIPLILNVPTCTLRR